MPLGRPRARHRRPLATFVAITLDRAVPWPLPRQPRRHDRAPRHQGQPQRVAVPARVDGQRHTLTFAVLLLTGAALGDRFGRQAHVHHRSRPLHRRVGARGPRHRRPARPRPGDPGRRWGDRHPAHADHPLGRRSARATRGALGLWGGIAGLAIALGPLVGGAITEGLSWHCSSSGSTSRSGSSWSRSRRLPAREPYGPDGALDIPGPRLLVSGGLFALVWGSSTATTSAGTAPGS